MNGAPLTRDHGFPVRLIVPGWYGCSCIKWVDRIELVADEAPATTQMQGVRGANASADANRCEPASRRSRATSSRRSSTRPRCRCASRSGWSTAASNTASPASSGAGRRRPTRCRSGSRRASRGCASTTARCRPVDAHVEPVVAHVAPGSARPLPDRAARRRPDDPHAPARSLFLRARRSRSTRSRSDRQTEDARKTRESLTLPRFRSLRAS